MYNTKRPQLHCTLFTAEVLQDFWLVSQSSSGRDKKNYPLSDQKAHLVELWYRLGVGFSWEKLWKALELLQSRGSNTSSISDGPFSPTALPITPEQAPQNHSYNLNWTNQIPPARKQLKALADFQGVFSPQPCILSINMLCIIYSTLWAGRNAREPGRASGHLSKHSTRDDGHLGRRGCHV